MKNPAAFCLTLRVGLALAGCGSSGSSTTTAAAAQSAPNAAKLQKARVEAAVCMRAQGIDVPDPSTAPVASVMLATVGRISTRRAVLRGEGCTYVALWCTLRSRLHSA